MKHTPGTWHADRSHFAPRRRDFLHVGWLAGAGLTLGDYFKLQGHAAERGHAAGEPKARNVIHIYLQGGFAHMDSFDPKPDAPIEYRGILNAIPTAIPGVHFSSHMASTAKIADKLTVVRSMTHTEVDHNRGIEVQMPDLDRAFSCLITDLDQRGLLDSTLVLITSEFGRTPRVNAGGGRDHWPRVFSIVMAGGGMKQGLVYGASDALAAEPADKPLSVEDYSTTLYHLLGIDASKQLMSPGDRPQAIVMNGKVVNELLA